MRFFIHFLVLQFPPRHLNLFTPFRDAVPWVYDTHLTFFVLISTLYFFSLGFDVHSSSSQSFSPISWSSCHSLSTLTLMMRVYGYRQKYLRWKNSSPLDTFTCSRWLLSRTLLYISSFLFPFSARLSKLRSPRVLQSASRLQSVQSWVSVREVNSQLLRFPLSFKAMPFSFVTGTTIYIN